MRERADHVKIFDNQFLRSANKLFLIISGALLSNFVLAQQAGLQRVTNEAGDLKIWLYGLLGVGCFLYVMFHIVMAMADKKSWGDVLMSLLYTAGAGGSLAAVVWAWGIWGT